MIELLRDPELYRIGPDYRATNKVFPVKFKGEKFIVKQPRIVGSVINAYYVLQDQFFYCTRKLSNPKQRFSREVECLDKLDGVHSPQVFAFDNNIIIREYLEGTNFRDLSSNNEQRKALDNGLEALLEIHSKGVIVGDAHVKNMFIGDKVYWLDFDGLFDESDFKKSKAVDILKFVYSSYSATRNKDLTAYSAEIASKNVNPDVKETVRRLITPGFNAIRLWFPTRLPLDGKLNEDVKKILRS